MDALGTVPTAFDDDPNDSVSAAAEPELDLGDRKQSAERAKGLKSEEARFDLMLEAICEHPEGRNFLRAVIFAPDWCHKDEPSLTVDPITTGFNEGARAVGTKLWNRLRVAAKPGDLVKFIQEI